MEQMRLLLAIVLSFLVFVVWQWLFFLPIAYVVGPVLGLGLVGVWVVNGVYRVGQAITCSRQWAGRKWAGIEI